MTFLPRFLSFEQILLLHKLQIDEYGGSHGLRDEGLLLSALAQPESGFGEEYLHKNLYEMAAAYLFHLVSNHPFHDGNKRIAALAASVFLEINGIEIVANEDEFEVLVLQSAQSKKTKEEIAIFFQKNSKLITKD